MPKYDATTNHGRQHRYYLHGEQRASYGIARQQEDGVYEFINDYGNFGEDYANYWSNPPHHYLVDNYGRIRNEGAFIVNYLKPKSPQPKKGFHR
jgi:hypothetical protein